MSGGGLLFFVPVLLAVLSMVFAAVWVYRDAKARGLSAVLWVLLVLLGGNFVGLILYLAIGRGQCKRPCGHCGSTVAAQGQFCPVCGRDMGPWQEPAKANGLLVACIVCIALALLSMVFLFASSFAGGARGFSQLRFHYGSYVANFDGGSARQVSSQAQGDTWEVTYSGASQGYRERQVFTAQAKPQLLHIEGETDGTAHLTLQQGERVLTHTVTDGTEDVVLEAFEPGKIQLALVNADATQLSATIRIETE